MKRKRRLSTRGATENAYSSRQCDETVLATGWRQFAKFSVAKRFPIDERTSKADHRS